MNTFRYVQDQWESLDKSWKNLVRNTPNLILIVDTDGTILFINRGIPGLSIQEILRKNIFEFIPPAYQHMAAKTLAHAVSEKTPGVIEAPMVRPDASLLWLEACASPLEIEGRTAGVILVCTDITRRKAAEEEQAKLIQIIENTSDLVSTTTPDFTPTYMNRAGRQMVGWPETGDLSSLEVKDLHSRPVMRRIVREALPAAVRDGIWSGETTVIGADGIEIPVSQIIMSHKGGDGEIQYFSTIARDISGIKNVEAELEKAREALEQRVRERTAELEKSRETYRAILESIEDGYYETDLKGNLTFFNAALERIMGHSREELLGLNNRDYTTPETSARIFRVFNQLYQTGIPVTNMDYQVRRKDSRLLDVEISATLIRDSQGAPTGFRGILRDISQRRADEQARKNLEKRLLMAQKLEAIGTLAGGIAHDFNNLLMGLQGNISLMLLEMTPDHPHYKRVRHLENYVQDAAGLTRQLLGFARGGKYEVKTTDINQLIKKTASMFGRTRKEITMDLDLGAQWAVDVDSGQIEQVLLNLFVNAWQAMPHGGLLCVQTQDMMLDEAFLTPLGLRPGKYVRISVADTGMGMDEATQQKVFDPFFTTKEMGRGTGLGLSSAYGIVRHHDGVISVQSAPDKGTTFNILLPASEKEIAPEKTGPKGIVLGTGAILLVDDESVILQTGREMLQALGYTVLTARSGREAAAIYHDHHQEIDMVILDMIMPDMNGGKVFELLKKIRPDVKVLLSSGYSMDGQAQQIMDSGCKAFIQKPFTLEVISYHIKKILGKPKNG